MWRHACKTCPLLGVAAIVLSTAATAWTPYGYGPYGPGYRSAEPPPGPRTRPDSGAGTDAPPTSGYPPYGAAPDFRFPGGSRPGFEGYGPRPPAYVPYGLGAAHPGMDVPAYGRSSQPLQISRHATDDAYVIDVQLEELKPEEIQVNTRGNWISIGRDQSRQEVREENFDQGHGYVRSYSFSSGGANRRFNVPGDADMEGMTREEGEGVLRLLIPRRRH